MMPNLDGVSATSQIRQFDGMTPIISMTSNTTANDIMTYFANGMNDILPKPFSRASLLSMLEKHLQHLRFIKLGEGPAPTTTTAGGSILDVNTTGGGVGSSHSDGSHHQLGMGDSNGMMVLDSSSLNGGTGRNGAGGGHDLKQQSQDTNDAAYDLQSLSYEEMMDSMERATQDYTVTRSQGHPAPRKQSVGHQNNNNNNNNDTRIRHQLPSASSSMPPSNSGYTTTTTITTGTLSTSPSTNHQHQQQQQQQQQQPGGPYGSGGQHSSQFSPGLDTPYGQQQHQQHHHHQNSVNMLQDSLLDEDTVLDQSQHYLSPTFFDRRKRPKMEVIE
jgi:hypothetical protein